MAICTKCGKETNNPYKPKQPDMRGQSWCWSCFKNRCDASWDYALRNPYEGLGYVNNEVGVDVSDIQRLRGVK